MRAMKASLSIGFSRHLQTRNDVSFCILPHCSGTFSHGYCAPIAWVRWGWYGRRPSLRTLTGANPLPVYMGLVNLLRPGVGCGILLRLSLCEGIFSRWSQPATNPHGVNLSQWGVEPCRLRRGLSSVARWDQTWLVLGGPLELWTGKSWVTS